MFAGVDTHKDTLAVAVIDHAGRVVRQLELPNQDSGYARLLALLTSHNVLRVGMEGSGNYGWPAAIYLLQRDLNVVEVPPLMTSRERLSRPGQGKTDPVDAVAIARITAREDALPPVRPMTGHAADLRVLTDYRDQLVNERTATANRVHTDLLWLRPGYQHQLPHLTNMLSTKLAVSPPIPAPTTTAWSTIHTVDTQADADMASRPWRYIERRGLLHRDPSGPALTPPRHPTSIQLSWSSDPKHVTITP